MQSFSFGSLQAIQVQCVKFGRIGEMLYDEQHFLLRHEVPMSQHRGRARSLADFADLDLLHLISAPVRYLLVMRDVKV